MTVTLQYKIIVKKTTSNAKDYRTKMQKLFVFILLNVLKRMRGTNHIFLTFLTASKQSFC